MSDNRELSYRPAVDNAKDHRAVVDMLCELVDELSPDEDNADVKKLFETDIRTALKSTTIHIVLALLGEEPIGLSRGDILTQDPIFRLREDNRCGYVDQMFVRKAYRDRGIGGYLMRLCEDWFREQGLKHCILHAAPKAVRFYARIGYQPNREMFKKL